MERVSRGGAAQVLIVMACVIIVLAGIKLASEILIPFLLAFFIAIILTPLVSLLERIRIPRVLAVFMVILLLLLLCFGLAGVMGSSMAEFKRNLPFYQQQINTHFGGVIARLHGWGVEINSDMLMTFFEPGKAMRLVGNLLSGFSGMMANLFLILLTTIFMLFEANSFPAKLHLIYRDPKMRLRQIDHFLEAVNNYLAMKALISLGTALLVGALLSLLGVDFVVLWMVLAFLLNFVPNIGSLLAAIPPVLLAFVQLGVGGAGAVALGYIVVNLLMGNVIEPRVMGRGLGLSTLVVFLSLIFWGWLLGSVGMLLSVPLTMIVKIGLGSSESTAWVSVLLGGDPVPVADVRDPKERTIPLPGPAANMSHDEE